MSFDGDFKVFRYCSVFSFLMPSKELIEKFDAATKDNLQKIKSNTNQIKTLTQLRDTLLPKLMSGEVRVNN